MNLKAIAKKIKNFFNSSLGIVCIFILLQIITGVTVTSAGDATPKIIHLYSIIKNNWKRDDIIYPAIDLDEDARLITAPEKFFFKTETGIKSVFPHTISYIYFPLSFIPIEYLHYTNGIFILFLLIYFKKITQISNLSLFILFFGSVYFYLSFGFSEYPIYLLLIGLGFAFSYRFLESFYTFDFTMFAIFIGLSTWLRIDSLLIFFVLSVFIFAIYLKNHSFSSMIQKITLGISLYIINLLLFGLYNYYNSGHILGYRFIANYDKQSFNFLEKLKIIQSILFFNIGSDGLQMGFFFCSLPLLIVFIWASFHFKQLKNTEKYLYYTTIVLSFVLIIVAPNSGFYLPARYLSSLLFPLSILYDKHHAAVFKNKIMKMTLSLSFVWSFTLIVAFSGFLKMDSLLKQEFKKYFSKMENQILFFTSESGTVNNLNLEYFKTKSMLVSSEKRIPTYEKILKEKTPSLFFIIKDDKTYSNKESLERTEKLIQIAKENQYKCENIDELNFKKFQVLERIMCKK